MYSPFLDLDKALKDLYEQRDLGKAIDYGETPPPPAFSVADVEWMEKMLNNP